MTEILRPLEPSAMHRLWVEVATARLSADLSVATAGLCLRVSDLPRAVLEDVAQRLSEPPRDGIEVYLVDRRAGPEPWRVAVHKVVERRNASEGVLLALFPPDLQLAAGDSVDISTFRLVSLAALESEVQQALVQRVPEVLRDQVHWLFRDLDRRDWPVTAAARLNYLATVAAQGSVDAAMLGGALFALGLIPDFELFRSTDEFHHRLGQLNIPAVKTLMEENATALERVLRLRLADETYRSQFVALFQQYPPRDIRAWGEAVATQSHWRALSLDRWPIADVPTPGRFCIIVEPLSMARRMDDGALLAKTGGRVVVAWRSDLPPLDVPGLTHYRIEVVNSDRVVVWESALIKTTKTVRRSKTFNDLSMLDPGVYFFRVLALNEVGDAIGQHPLRDPNADERDKRTNESEDFLLLADDESPDDDEDIEAPTNTVVSGFTEADLVARWSAIGTKGGSERIRLRECEWLTSPDARGETANATIRFDELQRQYTVRLGQRLRAIERTIIEAPDTGGHLDVTLGPQATPPSTRPLRLPAPFAAARRALFAALDEAPLPKGGWPVVALIDLISLTILIEEYARAYLAWLESGDSEALRVDVVVAGLPEHGRAALVAPTHPLRLLWLLQEQHLGRRWLYEAETRGHSARTLLETWREAISAQGIPALLVLDATEAYLDAGPLRGGWGAYLPPRLRDSRAVLSLLRTRLGSGAAHLSEADVAPAVLADKLAMFLRQHAYVQALTLNIVNPGDAELIVDALIELERRRQDGKLPPVRYDVRLITDSARRCGVGDAFRALLDPDRAISQAADSLVSPGRSFLFPKLSWSRNELDHLLEHPERFQAHITVLLDAFPITVRVARSDPFGRSSFVHGLVQEAPRRAELRGRYTWLRQPAPFPCPDLPRAPGRASLLAGLLSTIGSLQADVLAPNANTADVVAVTALDLTTAGQSLLYCAHNISTWVLTLDPHLGLDYFDEPRRGDRPGYLLDFTPEFLATGGRQLLLTTRIDEEVADLMAPAAERLHLDDASQAGLLLLESLRSLSGRLALRLLSAPSQVLGALGMALARVFLEAYDLLASAVVIPLDAHPELAEHSDGSVPRMRGDLVVASADVEARRLDLLIVEAKFRTGQGLDTALRDGIVQQLAGSELALREAFDPQWQNPDRIDRAVQSWRLTSVLSFYLERARRYGLVDSDAHQALRTFFISLDSNESYTLTIRKIGLVFRPDAEQTHVDQDSDVPVYVVGRDVIDTMMTAALRAFAGPVGPEPAHEAGPSTATGSLRDTATWSDVRRAFGGPTSAPRALPTQTPETTPPATALPGGATDAVVAVESKAVSAATEVLSPATPVLAASPSPAAAAAPIAGPVPSGEAPEAAYDILLGETRATPQYGLLGQVAAEPWRRVALDLNGCNTVSVFGVQGSGKSYTVGTIVEMAACRIARLNVLPQPLAAVVFHYHQTQDYPPEFVAMDEGNDDPAQVAALRTDWGAEPAALADVLVLTTEDTVQQRRQEFPRATVEPIAFASAELTVADWRFLMGATGSDAMYLKLVNEVMRKSRDALTLDAIRAGLADAPLSENQRALAVTRLDFAARFIDDAGSLRSHIRPGRLVVVDLRDEFIEQDQALGLFVTMLNVFAGAGMGSEPFNKLIIFDEAHKYMGGPLIGQVVGVIREMRHKGVSVVIASQDPVNVPPAVIELSSAVVLHRFNSPNWLRHIQKSLVALADLTPPMMAGLQPGEAFVWANKATDPTFTRRAVKVRMRPRATKHGGGTRTAV